MRLLTAVICCGLLAGTALGDTFQTWNFGSMSEVEQVLVSQPPLDFYARGDTEMTSMTVPSSGDYIETPIPDGLWINGGAHSFRVTYDVDTQRAGISIDNQYVSELPVTLDPDTNALLITAFADLPGGSVTVHNMRMIEVIGGAFHYYPPIGDPAIGAEAAAPSGGDEYLLIQHDTIDFTEHTWVLAGQVTMEWDGEMPSGDHQWFEIAPAVVPEPGSLLTLVMGGVLALWRRR